MLTPIKAGAKYNQIVTQKKGQGYILLIQIL